MDCPKCGFERFDGSLECRRCGIIFSKMRAPLDPATLSEVAFESDESPSLDREAWKSILAGLFLAIIVLLLPQARFVFHAFVTLIHELGHTIFGWIFGFPSIPAFDFTYGGGVTIHTDRSTLLVLAVYAGLAFLVYTQRKNLLTVNLVAATILLYTVLSFSRAHEAIIVFMGHGTELVIAGIFLFRALDGRACIHSIERPLYAFLAFFVILSDIRFAYLLWTSRNFRLGYRQAKGGGDWMDFSKLARDYLNTDLPTLAWIFLGLCLLVPVLALIAFWYRPRWSRVFR